MACNKCGNQSCLCTGINISSIKGNKGDTGANGTNGLNGDPGVGILSVIVDPTDSNVWIVTYTDGTTDNIPTPTTGTSTYFAWADLADGTGFTTTPSDKCFMAITNTLATVNTPIATDFVGRYFRINQPTQRFSKHDNVMFGQNVNVTSQTTTLFDAGSPTIAVPSEFFNSVGSYIEFEIIYNHDVVSVAGPAASIQTVCQINGYSFTLSFPSPSAPTDATIISKLRLFYVSPAATYLITESNIEYGGLSTGDIGVGGTLLNAPIDLSLPNITLSFQDMRSGPTNTNVTIRTLSATGFNPNKITC